MQMTVGHVKRPVESRESFAPVGRPQAALKCNNDCAIAKRNARLADALGITAESREKAMAATYHESLVAFARTNEKFLTVVEKAFHEFVTSQKKTQVLPHMPPERRKFVHDLAAVYKMDTEMVDQEPNRSVRLLRRLDTRVPNPLLSASIAASVPTAPNLGKLVDLRASSAPPRRVAATPSILNPAVPGWGPRPASAAPVAAVSKQPSRLTTSVTVSLARPPPLPRQDVPTSPTAVPDSWEDDP
ncbi:hypothetical protein C0995_000206 [Termitomyces sp. Mi166|nr:hypothetical protein C0995_000206 [Termitomyces sp. Mi166\